MFKVTRTSQPQQPVGIDWSNPLTRGLRVAVNAAGYNIARPSIATDKGKAFSWVRGTPNAIDTGVVNAAVSGHTCLVFARHPSLLTSYPEAYLSSSVAGNNGFTFSTEAAVGSTPNQTFKLSLTHGGIAQYTSVTNISGSNTSVLPLAFSATVSGSVRFFARGLFLDSVATGAINQNSSTLRIGGRPWFSDYYANYDLPGLFYWNRALSDAEIKSLSNNPWQIFQPTSRAIFLPAGAGGSPYTLTAEAGSIAVAGSDATLAFNRVLTADTANTPVAGADATLAFNRVLAADTANIPIAGAAATLAFNRALTADTANIPLAGQDATLTYTPVGGSPYTMIADTANVPITGADAGLSRGYTLAADTANIAISGSDAALIATRKLIAESMAIALAGADATLTYTPLTLPTVGRPTSDTSNTGWTPSTGVDLYPMVDEVTPDALDYISTTAIGSICKMALSTTAYPGTASQQLKFRASSSTGNSVIVRLKEGATTIRSATQVLTAVDTEYTLTLTSGEIAAITSGSLSVELESA